MIMPARAASTPMLTKVRNSQLFGIDAGELRSLFIAAQRVDAATDRGARGDEGIKRDENAHDDEHVWQAAIGGELIAEEDRNSADDAHLHREEHEGFVFGAVCVRSGGAFFMPL